ncbi:unnamed protein product [Cunninghamella echinulata]
MDIKIDKTMQTTILEPIQNGITNKTSWTSELEDINTIEKELDLLMNQYEHLSTPLLLEKFNSIKKNLSHWMEQAHLTVFKLEQQLKDGIPVMINNDNNHELSFMMMDRMDTLMSNLLDMNDIIINEKLSDQDDDEESETSTKMAFKMTITKTQSEWSGLQHFILSVSKKIEAVNEKRELLIMMENILLEIDQLTSIIFKYQEKRQYDLIPSSSPSTIEPTTTATTNDINETTLMADIDRRVDPVFLLVEKLYGRMTSSRPPYDESGILVKKHRKVQEKWECLRIEIDELKDDLKEDRWLAVFKQVADQVDPMIDGLDKTVQQCYQAIHQIIEWHDLVQQYQQQLQLQHHNTGLQSPHSPSAFDKITKTFLRSFPKSSHHSSSASSTSSSVSTSILPPPPPPPMDREKFKAMEKNFEAKYKYYTPSIDRMLNMLGNGIASRVNKDTSTCKRHTTMVNRWQQLKTVMDDLRIHDMVDAERYLIETPLSPANSMQSDRSSHGMWKSIRRRTSEQDTNSEYSNNSNNSSRKKGPSTPSSQYDDFRRVRSVTPSSGNYIYPSNNRQRTASPMNLSQQHYNHQHFPHYNNNRIIRPSTSDTSSVESTSPKQRPYITGRKSLTPNSHRPAWNANIKSDKQEFSSLEPLWKTESRVAASSSSFITNNNSDLIFSPPQNKKSHIPRPPSRQQQQTTKEASFMKPTKSTLLRKRSQSVEPRDMMRPKTPIKSLGKSSHQHNSNNNTLQTPTIVTSGGRRTKTPLTTSTQSPYQLPPRPKSSLARQETHDTLPYIDRERINGSKSPLLTTHRSNTPSLIPRPKTPTSNGKDFLRSSSPSLIPRPRSALRYYQQQQQDDDDHDYEGNHIPPVPPLPSNLERPSIHLLKVGKLNKQDIYSEVSDDDNDNDDHDNYVTPGSFLSVPPLFDSNNRSQSPSQEKHYYHSNNNNNNNINNYSNHTNNNQQLQQQQQQQLKKQQQKRELLKKRSMPALAMRRSNSPSSFTNNNNSNYLNNNKNNNMTLTQSPLSSSTNGRRRKNRIGYFSEDEDEENYYHQHNNNDHELTRGVKIAFQEHPIYTGDPRDPLDMEVATILNASPISIQCQKSPKGDGKYYFGNELNPTLGGGKKLYTCKLINYSDRPPRRQTSSSSTTTTKQHQTLVRNKVLVRVGGGWQDLEMFLLEHASLMTSDVVVRSFIH